MNGKKDYLWITWSVSLPHVHLHLSVVALDIQDIEFLFLYIFMNQVVDNAIQEICFLSVLWFMSFSYYNHTYAH